MTRRIINILSLALLAAIALSLLFAPELLSKLGDILTAAAGPGTLTLAMAGAAWQADDDSMVREVRDLIVEQGDAFVAARKKTDERLDDMQRRLDGAELKAGRAALFGPTGTTPASSPMQWVDTKTKARIPVLHKSDSLAALEAKAGHGIKAGTLPSMGRVLRGLVLGGKADDAAELADERKALGISSDPSGGYTVAGVLSSQWIDLMRAQMVLSRAGALTVPMDGNTLTLARVTGDPGVHWKAENAEITQGEPTFGAMTLTANTIVCLVRMSVELSQDSTNIEQILQSTIVNAMAGAIDRAGLVGVSTNAAAAPGGIFDLAGRNTVTSVGAPTSWDFVVDGMYELAADNVPMENIGALIAHPAVWRKMRKLRTGISGDNTPLTMPQEVAELPKLWTTAAPLAGGTTAKAVLGNWSDLLFGVRKQISVQVLSQSFMASHLQVAVLAYARVDFGATRAASFCTMEGISVA